MKKILIVLCCIILAFASPALASCSQTEKETLAGKTPQELYEESLNKVSSASEYSAESTQTITIVYDDGDEKVVTQTMSQKSNGSDEYAKLESDALHYESWYVDGVCYVSMDGYKLKTTISKEDYTQQYMEADSQESTLLDIPESWFNDIKFEKDGESWVLKFIVSAEKFNTYIDNIGLSGADITSDVEYKVFFDEEGNLQKIVTTFDYAIGDVATASCIMESFITLENVTITPPEDANSYQEVSLN